MSQGKTLRVKNRLTLAELERNAFPDHSVNLTELRKFAYAKKTGREYREDIAKHIETCDHCQRELQILSHVDTVLTGEEEQRTKVLVQAAEDPEVAQIVESRARKALFAAIGDRGKAAARAAADIVASLTSEGHEQEDEKEKDRREKTSQKA